MRPDPRLVRRLLGPAIAVLLVVSWFAATPARSPNAEARGTPRPVTPRGPLPEPEAGTIALFEAARGSVVAITTLGTAVDPWTRNVFRVPRGSGSGFIWDRFGHVVTNHHVIADAASATVKLADGRSLPATLVGASRMHDLAVLRITLGGDRPEPIPIGTSHDLRVGQRVLAIGNPFGLDWTLTTGIVSALNRELPTEDGGTIRDLIQTDAAINPGNSGGPLIDSAGRLIGVNTAIYSPSGASAGIGFAVPVDTVNRVVPRLIAEGRYVPPSLGIEGDERINAALAARTGLSGVFVLRVTPGSVAAQAGIRPARISRDGNVVIGDVITALAGRPLRRVADLTDALDPFRPGDAVTLSLTRDGRRLDLTLTLQPGR